MPITVKDYTWEETETSVFITVPLKGVQAKKTDIFSTDEYIKVNYPPYLFEVDLFAPVLDDRSTAQVGNGTVVFKLVKKDPGIWTRLTASSSGDKKAMIEKREKEIEKAQQKAEEQKKVAAERKREEQKYALREQMRLEEEERARVESTKKAEREQAMAELEAWKKKQVQEESVKSSEEQNESGKQEQGIEVAKQEERKSQGKVQTTKKIEAPKIKSEATKKKSSMFDDNEINVPAIRSTGKIEVNFTPRVFPTPVRESKLHEEEEWLKKQAEAMRAAEIDDPNLSEEEKNPLWLKEKGDGFYQSGNFLAAVNAYSQAIRMDSKMPALYSNRSACHLQVRNFHKALQDSSRAMELLTPAVPANAAARCKAHVRRGTAFCELEMYVEGLMDYEAALKIDPKNEALTQDAERIRQIIQTGE